MTISVITSTLASAYGSTLLGPRALQNNSTAPDDGKAALNGDASTAGGNGTPSAGGQRTSTNFQARSASATPAPSDSGGDDATSQTIKQLERQLRQVLQQIQRLQASSIPDEQKAPQLQALNAEAATLQAQISALIEQQVQAAKGVTTA
ncbi:FlxA-like family protein [Bordetella genomosp. 11]|uniref:FlxA-like family protein n=1 Tax=Bordetella genomosp. 11 TaxID=1416808 RepID=UPI001595C8F9|nr:FlxA-like family protein [Bordetella genomosp. 11]